MILEISGGANAPPALPLAQALSGAVYCNGTNVHTFGFGCADVKQVSHCWDLVVHPRGLHPFNPVKLGIRQGSYGQFNPNTT